MLNPGAMFSYCYTMGQQLKEAAPDTNNNGARQMVLSSRSIDQCLVGDVGMSLRHMANECMVQRDVDVSLRHNISPLGPVESLVQKNVSDIGMSQKQIGNNNNNMSLVQGGISDIGILNRHILPTSSQCLVQRGIGAIEIPQKHITNECLVQRGLGDIGVPQRQILTLGTIEECHMVQKTVNDFQLEQRPIINDSLGQRSVGKVIDVSKPMLATGGKRLVQRNIKMPQKQTGKKSLAQRGGRKNGKMVSLTSDNLVGEVASLSGNGGGSDDKGVSSKVVEAVQQTSVEETDSNNNSSANNTGEDELSGAGKAEVAPPPRKSDKYSLRPRSIQKRLETEQRGRLVAATKASKRSSSGGGGGRPKQKPPPLSKYRRKTANARERDRMREINTAFETLRRAVPHLSDACSGNEKLTKITTLRLAMKYIAALSQALHSPEPELGSLADLDCLLLGSDGESLALHSDLSELDDPCLGDAGHPFTPPGSGHPFTPPELEDLFS